MADYRTNYAKDITEMLHDSYGSSVGILDIYIHRCRSARLIKYIYKLCI